MSAPPPTPRRLSELDAVRGLAAVSVMLGHSAIIFPAVDRSTRGDGLTALNLLKYTPLSLFIAGGAAVIVFFVLSGFVLTLPQMTGRGGSYRDFLTRRVCRIWIPYVVAVALAMVVSLGFTGETDGDLSGWFNAEWRHAPGAGAILGHLTLVFDFDNGAYNPVLWSLVHEMRISLVFPFLAAAVLAAGTLRSLSAALAAALAAFVVSDTVITGTDYFRTVEYAFCFVVGILLAAHRHEIAERLAAAGGRARAALWVVAVLGLAFRNLFGGNGLPDPVARVAHLTIVETVVTTAGAAAVIVLAQGGGARRVLRRPVPQFLGRISYSLYLVHAVVLLAVLHALPRSTDPLLALPAVWVLAIALAALMQRWVERPAQQLGRRLTGRVPPHALEPA